MAGLLKKRCREDEAPLDSLKRFRGETEQLILHFLEDIDSADKSEEEEKCAPSEEVVSGVMRSLEEEIGITGSSELRRDDSVSSDVTSRCETQSGGDYGGINLGYLLEASDDDLGIPPSPLQNLENQPGCSREEGFGASFDFAESPEPKSFVDNWLFEDDFVDYRQYAVFEDAAAAFDTAR